MSQKTLFHEPEPDRLEPGVIYGTLEDDEPPFGLLMYSQDLAASLSERFGNTYATMQFRRIWDDYRRGDGT